MDVMNGSAHYHVGDQVAVSDQYRTYICTQIGTGRLCLLQVATEVAHNGVLDRWAYVLRELEARSAAVEAEYAKTQTDPKMRLNYGLQFPEIVDSFLFEAQGGRRINIVAFRHVDDPRRLVPLDNLSMSSTQFFRHDCLRKLS